MTNKSLISSNRRLLVNKGVIVWAGNGAGTIRGGVGGRGPKTVVGAIRCGGVIDGRQLKAGQAAARGVARGSAGLRALVNFNLINQRQGKSK